jgi:hypothetical protein
MKKVIFLSIVIVISFGIIVWASRIVFGENTGASFLKIGVGARAIGMGSAFCAIADDVNAVHWNPAGISQVSQQAVSAMHTQWITDISYDFVGYLYPSKIGTFGGSLIYLSQGKLEGRDENREVTGEFEASDIALTLSYGRALPVWNKATVRIGANLKLISQKIEIEQASGVAIDLGLLIRPNSLKSIQFGVSLQNLGPQMSFISEGYNLPLTMVAGAGYGIGGVTLALDIKQQIHEGRTDLCIGTEYLPIESLALRAGYLMNILEVSTGESIDNNGFSTPEGLGAGIGFQVFGINTDFSFTPYGDLGNTQNISFSAKF